MAKQQQNSLAIKDETPFLAIEQVSEEYHQLIEESRNDFIRMVVTAKAVSAMKKLLTDEIVGVAMALQNTKMGFKTDKKQGYDIATIRNCMIEAHLNGVRIIGNEFNIIAGQMYITKEGFIGKMQRSPDFSNVKLDIGIPRINQAEKRAIVPCSATWNYLGEPDSIKCEIPVKWDSYSSDDAIIGKAERKLRARIWNQATGDIVMDGDADGAINVVAVATATPVQVEQENEQTGSKAEQMAQRLKQNTEERNDEDDLKAPF